MRVIVAWDEVDCLVHVAIAASDDNVVLISILAVVHRVLGSDWASPEDALDQCSGRTVPDVSVVRRILV